jgi:hypothetical protein
VFHDPPDGTTLDFYVPNVRPVTDAGSKKAVSFVISMQKKVVTSDYNKQSEEDIPAPVPR